MEPHAGETIAGYRIVELAGRGSSGTVYRAVDGDGAHVAIKKPASTTSGTCRRLS